jgi:AcrR family transcriptional regulator
MRGITLSPLGKREQTKARNRAVILAAARNVFAALGYEATTVRDVIRATDLSVGTFYEYFRDKEEVFTAVAEDAWGALRARLREARRDRRLPLETRVYRAYRAYFRAVVEERTLYTVLERMLWSNHPLAERSVTASLEELREDLLLDFNVPALRGEDPEIVAAAMVGTGLMVARQMLHRGAFDAEEAARFCTRFTLSGVVPAANSLTPASTSLNSKQRKTA